MNLLAVPVQLIARKIIIVIQYSVKDVQNLKKKVIYIKKTIKYTFLCIPICLNSINSKFIRSVLSFIHLVFLFECPIILIQLTAF